MDFQLFVCTYQWSKCQCGSPDWCKLTINGPRWAPLLACSRAPSAPCSLSPVGNAHQMFREPRNLTSESINDGPTGLPSVIRTPKLILRRGPVAHPPIRTPPACRPRAALVAAHFHHVFPKETADYPSVQTESGVRELRRCSAALLRDRRHRPNLFLLRRIQERRPF